MDGGGQFRRTCKKLEWVRWAAVANRLDCLPIDWLGDSDPAYWRGETGASDRYERYIRWWAPNVLDAEPYDEDHKLPPLTEWLRRYPTQDDTDAELASQDESEGEEETKDEGDEGDEDISMKED